jgi:hypothetical protein
MIVVAPVDSEGASPKGLLGSLLSPSARAPRAWRVGLARKPFYTRLAYRRLRVGRIRKKKSSLRPT